MQVQWWGYHEVVSKRDFMEKNLVEIFTLTGGWDAKTLGASARAQESPLWNF